MDENMKENSIKNTGINVDQDSLQNLAIDFLKNQNSLDLGSLMQMATTLLKNDSLMNSVMEMSKNKQNPSLPESKSTKKRKKVKDDNSVNNTGNNVDKDSLDLNSLMHLATTLTKNESLLNPVTEHLNATLPVSKVSEQQENVELTSLFQKLENITNDLSGLRQENSELASLSQKLENITNDISGLRQENSELASLSQKLENITNDISELKKGLKDVKEQNSDLLKLLKKLLKNNKK